MFYVFLWNIVGYSIQEALIFRVIDNRDINDWIIASQDAPDGLYSDSIRRSYTSQYTAFNVVKVLSFDELADYIELVYLVVIETLQNFL